MLREGLRLSRRHRAWLYGTFSALFVSGLLWLVFRRWVRVEGEFGASAHPLEPWWLKLHGAAAMAFLLVLGTLVRGHVRLGWKLHQNRLSGSTLLATNALLAATGWALYYVGGESVRAWVSVLHWGLGLAAPALILVHVVRGRQAVAAARRDAMATEEWRDPALAATGGLAQDDERGLGGLAPDDGAVSTGSLRVSAPTRRARSG